MLLLAYLKPFFLPQTMYPFDVHSPALMAEEDRDPAIPEPRPEDRQPMDCRYQDTLALVHLLFVPLAGPRLANGPADPPAGIAQPISKIRHRLAPAGRAQEFFELYSIASLMISKSIR